VIVRILTGVFDPPPERLTIPTGYLLALLVATVGAVVVAGVVTLASLQRPVLERIRDL
jgi:putative ABC transport system permease protein